MKDWCGDVLAAQRAIVGTLVLVRQQATHKTTSASATITQQIRPRAVAKPQPAGVRRRLWNKKPEVVRFLLFKDGVYRRWRG